MRWKIFYRRIWLFRPPYLRCVIFHSNPSILYFISPPSYSTRLQNVDLFSMIRVGSWDLMRINCLNLNSRTYPGCVDAIDIRVSTRSPIARQESTCCVEHVWIVTSFFCEPYRTQSKRNHECIWRSNEEKILSNVPKPKENYAGKFSFAYRLTAGLFSSL